MTAEWNYDSDDDQNMKASRKKRDSASKSPSQTKVISDNDNDHKSSKETTNRPKTNVTPEPSSCIGIFGLSKQTTERTLWKTFGNFGKIKTVSLIVDKFTKESLGFAFINYEDLDSATNAIKETNGMSLDEKTVRVDYSITKKAYTPTPGCGYKGKNISRASGGRDGKKNFKRKFSPRSRSRSSSRKRSAMKYLSARHFSPSDSGRSFPPSHFHANKRGDSFRKYDNDRRQQHNSPEPHYEMDYYQYHSSSHRNIRGYSPQINREIRDFSPNRDDSRNYYSDRTTYPPRNANYSPEREDFQRRGNYTSREKNSPFRGKYSEFSPGQEMRIGFPQISDYPMRQAREFSPIRNGGNLYNSQVRTTAFRGRVSDESPIRKNVRVYSPTRAISPARYGYRQYSPVRVDKYKDNHHRSIVDGDNQQFFY